MSPKAKIYKKEYAHELLRIAGGDVDTARASLQLKLGRPENIAYLCQQAVEKALKALICYSGEPVPHTHTIESLLQLLPVSYAAPHPASLVGLTEYALGRRYEESREVTSYEDFASVISLTDETIAWAQQIVSKK